MTLLLIILVIINEPSTTRSILSNDVQSKQKRKFKSSIIPKEDAIVTEIVNGLIVSKPAKKIEYLSTEKNESEPVVIDLQEHAKSKAGSVNGINKLKVIHNFIASNGRH